MSNSFGVGGYRRPFAGIRSAGVRFASECLAIANVGDRVPHPNDPAWKEGVPKDEGTDWDFDDPARVIMFPASDAERARFFSGNARGVFGLS